jgi:hypothetical protein
MRADHVLHQLLGLEPLFGLAVFLAVLGVAFRRRTPQVAAAVVVLGAVLAFQVLAFIAGSTVGFLRYQIVIIPLATLLAGSLVGGPQRGQRHGLGAVRTARQAWSARTAAFAMGLAAVAIVGVALPVGLRTMKSSSLAPAESYELSAVLNPGEPIRDQYENEREVARYVDSLSLPRGSVLVDTFSAVPIVLSSRHPEQFVITSDRDFKITLADPSLWGVKYLLDQPPVGLGRLNAVNREFPTLYETGRPVGKLVRQFTNRGNPRPSWRMYEIGSG